MRKFPSFSLILILFISFIFSSRLIGYAATASVIEVIDGDTILLAGGEKVRYLGIDAPELGTDGGPAEFMSKEAAHFNRELVLTKEVCLKYGPERRDRFGRVLAYVFLKNGMFVNAELVKKGFAYVFYHGPSMDRFDGLLQCQREAIRDKRGIWAKNLKEGEDSYRGQIHSRRFHRQECPLGKGIARKNLIIFRSKKEAYWEGYSPCRTCKP